MQFLCWDYRGKDCLALVCVRDVEVWSKVHSWVLDARDWCWGKGRGKDRDWGRGKGKGKRVGLEIGGKGSGQG